MQVSRPHMGSQNLSQSWGHNPEKDETCRGQVWSAVSRAISVTSLSLGMGVPRKTGRRVVLPCTSSDVTPGWRANKETVVSKSLCSLDEVSLGPSLGRAGMWQSQGSHLKPWNVILLHHPSRRSPWQWVPRLQWYRLCGPHLSVTSETLDLFWDIDQIEFVNSGSGRVFVYPLLCSFRRQQYGARQKPESWGSVNHGLVPTGFHHRIRTSPSKQ